MAHRVRFSSLALFSLSVAAVACGSSDANPGTSTGGFPATGGSTAQGGSGANGGAQVVGGTSGSGSTIGGSSPGGTSAGGSSAGGTSAGGASAGSSAGGTDSSGAPAGFWDPSNIPPAKNVMVFKFLNRTNGKYPDSQVFWSFKSNTVNEVHSFAEKPLYDMPANASGRMYFYLEQPNSKYYDFIEFTIGTTRFNGNTTRVDAFGLKVAMRMHCADGFDVAVGEDYATFQEDRAATFQKFQDEAPAEFKDLAVKNAPYRIVEPGADGFNPNQPHATYYDSFIDEIWSANGLTIPKPGPNGSGLGAFPDISAAIFRHVGNKAGTFSPDGKLLDHSLWTNAATFYTAAPADYYARYWHVHGLNGKAYGFPYDDVGGYSSYISHDNPQYLEVAVGW